MLEAKRGVAAGQRRAGCLPERTAARMSRYLRVLEENARRGVATVSSHQMAQETGVRSSLVRRDMSGLGRCGTPGRGYDVDLLMGVIRKRLRLGRARPTVWLGAARLADEEGTRQGLEAVNCRLVGVFDDDWDGGKAAGLSVQPLSRVKEKVRRQRATVAVLASEEAARLDVMQELVSAGIRAVLNLTAMRLPASANVAIEQGDLGSQLFRLLCRVEGEARRAQGAGRG